MGYIVKIQRVERGATQSFYVNFPAAVAEAAGIVKGEEMEWLIEDKNTFLLQRIKLSKERRFKSTKSGARVDKKDSPKKKKK